MRFESWIELLGSWLVLNILGSDLKWVFLCWSLDLFFVCLNIWIMGSFEFIFMDSFEENCEEEVWEGEGESVNIGEDEKDDGFLFEVYIM